MGKLLAITDYINGIKQGNISVLSRAITLIESKKKEYESLAIELIDAILPLTGNSLRIGITGVPGVGKSTFIDAFGMNLVAKGKKIAILAIDPSSSLSRGSILGDKTRMERLANQPNVFIRPSASSGSLGGITYKTKETILLCEAAGFDTIIIETVGVGQSETDVSSITDFFLLLMLAGAGDELQGIKRGIMELADGIAITKADNQNITRANVAAREFSTALHFFPPTQSGWIPEVKVCSAIENSGIEEIITMIQRYENHTKLKGYFNQKRIDQNILSFHQLLTEKIKRDFFSSPLIKEKILEFEHKVFAGLLSPYAAVKAVFE